MPRESAVALEDVLRLAIEMNATDLHVSLTGLVDVGWVRADDALESCFDQKAMARILGRK